MKLRSPRDTEADATAANDGIAAVETVRRAAVVGELVPVAAAQHAVRS